MMVQVRNQQGVICRHLRYTQFFPRLYLKPIAIDAIVYPHLDLV